MNITNSPFTTSDQQAEFDSGVIALLILSSAQVMLMTPGLAFFYGGLVNKNSVLNVMLQSFVSLIVIDIIWFIGAYSLCFSGDVGGVIGNGDRFFLMNVFVDTPDPRHPEFPELLFIIYQMMFAIVAPALITGAFVNRIRFKAYCLFLFGWTLFVYVPFCHWVWGDGFLARWGVQDFAGGLVVHELAGFAALSSVLYVGKRRNYTAQPHSIPLATLGATLLWFGWYGFNAGSSLSSNGISALAFLNTDIAGSVSSIIYVGTEWIVTGKPKLVGLLIGSVTGLVTVTPLAGYVSPWAALILGGLGAQLSYWAIWLKKRAGVDDALDVFSIHAIPGLFGMVMAGLFADSSVNPDATKGLFYDPVGGLAFLGKQIVAALFAGIWSFAITYGLLASINFITPVRATPEEQLDIDSIELGEAAYLEKDVDLAAEIEELPESHWEVWSSPLLKVEVGSLNETNF